MFNPSLYLPDFTPSWGTVRVPVANPGLILPADPFRVYVAITQTSGDTLTVGFDPNLATGVGPWVLNQFQTLEIWWERYGVLCTLPIYGNATSPGPIGGATVYYLWMQFKP